MSLNIVFPEETGRLPTSKLPLQFKHVLAVAYVFGGVYGMIALISKFIVTPLFEQLTVDRQIYAQEARYKLEALNARLSKIVSTVPSIQSIRNGYVDAKVQTGTGYKSSRDKRQYKPQDWAEFKQLTSFDEGSVDISGACDEVEDLEKYMRNLAFGLEGPQRKSGENISNLRAEIRQFKGALIAL